MVFAGFLTDGCTAERRSIYLTLSAHALCLCDEHGFVVDEWLYAGLGLIDKWYGDQPVRLSHCDRRDVCLTVEDPSFFLVVRNAVPQFRQYQRVPRRTLTHLLAWGLAVVVTVMGLIWQGPRLADPLAHVVPIRWEELIGQQITNNFVQQSPVCTNRAGETALRGLVARLTATTPMAFPLKIHVRRSQTINAFALPGGHIVIFQGLLQAARSPEEIAGVLAHEIAHQIQRHPMRGLVRATGVRLIGGAVLGGFSVTTTSSVHFGETLFSLSYNREDESEADRVGVALLNKADIRGDGLIEFFSRYQGGSETKSPSREVVNSAHEQLMSLLSTHPPGQERIAVIRSLVRGTKDALTKEQWRALQTICGEEPRKG